MGSKSTQNSRTKVIENAKATQLCRNPGNALSKLVAICSELGEDWCLRVYWSSGSWEIEIKSSYGILEYASAVNKSLLAAAKTIALKITKDATNGSIHL